MKAVPGGQSSILAHAPTHCPPGHPCPPQVAEGSLHPLIPPDCHPRLAELLAATFSPDPLERPSFGLIVACLEAVLHEARLQAAAAQTAAGDGLLGRWLHKAAAAAGGSSGSLRGSSGNLRS